MNIWNDVPLGVSVGPVLAHCRDYLISVSEHFSSSSRVFEHRILVVPSSVTPRCAGALLHPAIDSADLAGEWRCNERIGNLLLACVVFLELAVILFVLFFFNINIKNCLCVLSRVMHLCTSFSWLAKYSHNCLSLGSFIYPSKKWGWLQFAHLTTLSSLYTIT